MFFEQVPIGGYDKNFNYFLGRDSSLVCVVDPVEIDNLMRIAQNIGVGSICAVLITHSHHDHISGTPELNARLGGIPVYIHESGAKELNVPCKVVNDGDLIHEAGLKIKVHHTPGHRFDSVLYEVDDNLITGDTLFVDCCGRCDLPGSDVNAMYKSLYETLPKLKKSLKVWPGHDYGKTPSSTLEKEFLTNSYLNCAGKEEFIALRMG
jgi:glyoxylase-like metal-dependent hydrolase (beta-lactamase superfamily II)